MRAAMEVLGVEFDQEMQTFWDWVCHVREETELGQWFNCVLEWMELTWALGWPVELEAEVFEHGLLLDHYYSMRWRVVNMMLNERLPKFHSLHRALCMGCRQNILPSLMPTNYLAGLINPPANAPPLAAWIGLQITCMENYGFEYPKSLMDPEWQDVIGSLPITMHPLKLESVPEGTTYGDVCWRP